MMNLTGKPPRCDPPCADSGGRLDLHSPGSGSHHQHVPKTNVTFSQALKNENNCGNLNS